MVILVDNNVGTSLQPGHHLGGHSAKEPSVFSQSQTRPLLRPSPNRKHLLYHLRHVPCNLCVGVFNLEKALLVVIVKSSRRLVCSSSDSVGHVYSGHLTWSPSLGVEVDTAVTRLHSTLGQTLLLLIFTTYRIQDLYVISVFRCFSHKYKYKLN